MNLVRAPRSTILIKTPECEAPIRDQIGFEAEVTGHANGRLNRIVGDHAGDNKARISALAQPLFQSCTNERIVRAFSDDRLPWQRGDFRLEVVSRLTRAIVRSGF